MDHIRNFSIIAHIDHGKSTLADRMLDVTGTIEKRKMRAQVLDQMELEQERGITIKMQPVRMEYEHNNKKYELNLIDTPGHIDFSYEVSRALKAVEGAILLVDSTQGIQAQTLTVLEMARDLGLTIVPAVTKIDAGHARVDDVILEVAEILQCEVQDVLAVSGKTGDGVEELLTAVIERIPSPTEEEDTEKLRGLVFDFTYSNHRGVVVHTRIFSGTVSKSDSLQFCATKERFNALEVGAFKPHEEASESLSAGEIGYIVTGIKEAGSVNVGDTITFEKNAAKPLSGYLSPKPVVWSSLYPESQDDFPILKQALARLKLSDSALTFEEEQSGALGRGYRCGFLGLLHLEIVSERLKREFSLELIITLPSVIYVVEKKGGDRVTVYTPSKFPNHGDVVSVEEPWIAGIIIAPYEFIGSIQKLLFEHEAEQKDTISFGDGRQEVQFEMPLRELYRNFFDELKSLTKGYASLSYKEIANRPADVVRLDALVAGEDVPALTRVVSRRRVQEEAETLVTKLHETLPRQLFTTKIQGVALGRILSSKTLKALRKDVTGYLYGGDVTRKKKLLEKQKKGKKKMQARGKVNIPHDTFLRLLKP